MNTKMTQREAVYAATHSVLKDQDKHFEDKTFDITTVVDKSIRESIHAIVCESFKAGKVEFKNTPSNAEKLENPAKLSSYVSGLISNWFRKDKRFNGDTTYEPKNPGSRAGQGDQVLKSLRGLHKQYSGVNDEQAAKVQLAIDNRLSEIRTEKAKSIKIDMSVLPASLIEELGLDLEAS